MERYCVGAGMEIDWAGGDARPRWDWCLAKRVFGYFRPYWRHELAAVVCLAAGGLYAELSSGSSRPRSRPAPSSADPDPTFTPARPPQ